MDKEVCLCGGLHGVRVVEIDSYIYIYILEGICFSLGREEHKLFYRRYLGKKKRTEIVFT